MSLFGAQRGTHRSGLLTVTVEVVNHPATAEYDTVRELDATVDTPCACVEDRLCDACALIESIGCVGAEALFTDVATARGDGRHVITGRHVSEWSRDYWGEYDSEDTFEIEEAT